MKDVKKGYRLIFTGLLIGTFTQAMNVNDVWNMYKIIMYFLSSALVIIGYLGVLSFEKINKFRKSLQIFVYLAIYSVVISLLYMKFGGLLSSLVSMILIVTSYRICIKSS